MKIQRQIFTLLLLAITFSSYSQYIGYEKVNYYDVWEWIPESKQGYQGVYHFGESEGESSLIVLVIGDKVVAQIREGEFNEEATEWILNYTNLTNVSIGENGEFYSDQYSGKFASHKKGLIDTNGLKIVDPWSGTTEQEGEYELGRKVGTIADEFYGSYTKASIQLLKQSDLKSLSKSELQLMRNEIFARYGYQFQKGGAMDSHFSKLEWHHPNHSNVDNFLTWLEKENIELIQKEEAKK